MTNQEKIQIWEALYKCTRNGYPGATYEQYDTPKDPRVRGGRWNWTYHQLRDLYEQLVKWGEANEPTAAWRELEKYKNKIPPACLRTIFQSITFLPSIVYTITPTSLSITEGQTVTFNILTAGVPDGTVLYWTLYSTSPNPITAADFTDGLGDGSVTITSSAASFTRTLENDFISEPPEYFNIQLRTGSIVGPVVATSVQIEVLNNPEPLRFVFTDLTLLPFAATTLAGWNTFLDIPGTGGVSPFTSIEVIGTTEVRLRGASGSSVKLIDNLFINDTNLVSVFDYGGFVNEIGISTFDGGGGGGITSTGTAYFPEVTTIGDQAFNFSYFNSILLPAWNSANVDVISGTGVNNYDISGYVGDYYIAVNNNAGTSSPVTAYLNDSIMTGNSGLPFTKSIFASLGISGFTHLLYTPSDNFYVGIIAGDTIEALTGGFIFASYLPGYYLALIRTGNPIPDLGGDFKVEINPISGSFTPAVFGGSYTYSYPSNSSTADFLSFTFIPTGLVGGETFNIKYSNPTLTVLHATSITYTYIAIPNVANGTVGSFTTTSVVISNNNATSDGGGTISVRGVVYSSINLTPVLGQPSTFDNPSGSGLGLFNNSLAGLSQNTLYRWRAYVTNQAKTSYASVATFTTIANPVSAVVTSITTNSATMNGNSVSGTGTITGRGVCYSSSNTNPTILDSVVTSGTGTGSFNATMTGLSSGTTYYARAYATNVSGTGYGTVRTFTTL